MNPPLARRSIWVLRGILSIFSRSRVVSTSACSSFITLPHKPVCGDRDRAGLPHSSLVGRKEGRNTVRLHQERGSPHFLHAGPLAWVLPTRLVSSRLPPLAAECTTATTPQSWPTPAPP